LIVSGAAFCRNNGKIEAPYTNQCLHISRQKYKGWPYWQSLQRMGCTKPGDGFKLGEGHEKSLLLCKPLWVITNYYENGNRQKRIYW
jgi:hypothetical protein